ncbi:MAG TPA: DoxX family protein [Candidatus Omnitrophota bacterium]|nr:DoxX family protein [Candidatus Omnitrophota bacterium]
MNIFVLLRWLIGLLFIVSGGEKLIGPFQNFLYVVESYEAFPRFLQEIIAHALPWGELFLGIFVLLGLWTKAALRGVLVLIAGFVLIVSQAIIRQLPITECGCFGELMSFPLPVVLIFDSSLFIITLFLLRKFDQTVRLSLDQHFG